MSYMRETLAAFMAYRDENAYGLEERSTVPQATINRYLTGKHANLSTPNVQKLAAAYGLTESQLRGDAILSRDQQIQLLNGSKKLRYKLMMQLGIHDPLQITRNNPLATEELLDMHAFIEALSYQLERDEEELESSTTFMQRKVESAPDTAKVEPKLTEDEQIVLDFFKNSGQEVKDAMLRMAGHQGRGTITAQPELAINKFPHPERSTGKQKKTDVR